MNKLFHNPIFGHIRKYFESYDSERNTIFIFVPYIKTNVLAKLVDDINSRIVVITTWNPRDIQTGASELELYPFCYEHNIFLYINNNIHLKIHSINLEHAILTTGNISHRGLMPDGNYEAGIFLEKLTNENRLFFESIRNEAQLVDDIMYNKLKKWVEDNKIEHADKTTFADIVSIPQKDNFLISALPMTYNVDELIAGYNQITLGNEPSTDPEISSCIFHDLTNYNIKLGLSEKDFIQKLREAYFAHPFIQKIDEFIDPDAHFGRIKEWIQDNCTDVPVPGRRELTENVQVLFEWFVRLGDGKYEIDVPGRYSERLVKKWQ